MNLNLRLPRRLTTSGLLLVLALSAVAAGCSPVATEPGTTEVIVAEDVVVSSEAVTEEVAVEEVAVEEVAVEDVAAEDAVVEEPVAASEAEAAPEAAVVGADVDWSTVYNKMDDGRHVVGNPDAPVTLIEYSDFM